MQRWYATLRQGLSRSLPEDRIGGVQDSPGAQANLHNLRPFFVRHWRKAVGGALLVLFSTLLGLVIPLITRYVIDEIILDRQLQYLLWAALAFATVKGTGLLAKTFGQFAFTRFEQEMLLDIQERLLDRTLRLPKSFFDEQEIGYLMARLTSDVGGLRRFFSSTLVYLLTELLRFLGGTAFLFHLEWRLTLVALVLVPGLVFTVRFFTQRSRILSHQQMEQQANVSRRLQESLSAASLIKSFAAEDRTMGHIVSDLRASFQATLESMVLISAAGLILETLGYISRGVALLAGAYLVITSGWTLGSLLAFYTYLSYMLGPAQFLATANIQLQSALSALERVSALFDIVPEENLRTGRSIERLTGDVEFRDVSFSYDAGEPVLEHVSFHVYPGQRVSIVGPSGVGKTTLLSLVLRLYKPTQGEIWFDGLAASEYELSSLRRRIGYVAQSTLLLSGTILDNLRFGSPEACQEEVEQAARVAGIHDFVIGLPQGYESPVGERGVNLSEGQQQRLAIARALIKDPDILIMDEPTAALDSVVEQSIFEALPAAIRDKTLFVVTHRLSTVQHSDRILLLDEKRLVATGTHQQLMQANPYYRSLVERQRLLVPPPGATKETDAVD